MTARAARWRRRPRDRLRVGADEAAIGADDMARRLLQADVAWRGLRGPLEDEYQASARYEFLRLNATAPAAFGDRAGAGRPQEQALRHAARSLRGVRARGWRANDWLWGRLDGAARLVDLLLAPTRLRLSPRAPRRAGGGARRRRRRRRSSRPSRRAHGLASYVEPDDEGGARFWRGAFRDALADAIVGAELGAARDGDRRGRRRRVRTASRTSAPRWARITARASGSGTYAGLLCGTDGGTGIEARVARERGSTPATDGPCDLSPKYNWAIVRGCS